MYSGVICVFIVVVLSWVPSTTSAKDKVHIKVHVPEFVNHHTHTKYVFLHDKEPKKTHKSKANYQFGPQSYFNYEPYFEDGYHKAKSWKTVKSEKYETETVDNPHSDYPGNKYIVKSSYKVREKLPYDDTTIGYDREYQYPSAEIGDGDYHKNEKIVDYHNKKHDPFPTHQDFKKKEKVIVKEPKGHHFDIPDYEYFKNDNEHFPVEHLQEFVQKDKKKKPKEIHYSYKVPSDDYDFHKSVQLVDYYLKKNNNDVSAPLHEEPKDNHNEIDYEIAKSENSNLDHYGPTAEHAFESSDSGYSHFDEYGDYSNVKAKKKDRLRVTFLACVTYETFSAIVYGTKKASDLPS